MKQIITLLTLIATALVSNFSQAEALNDLNSCTLNCAASSVSKPVDSTYNPNYKGEKYQCPSWAKDASYSAYCQGLLLWSDVGCYRSCVKNAIPAQQQLRTDVNTCYNQCAMDVSNACMRHCDQVDRSESPTRWKCTNDCATQVIDCFKGCAKQINDALNK